MKLHELNKWDKRMLDLALTVGGWSKGPRKRIGAVITRPDRSVASMGYNGPPRGYNDAYFLTLTREEQHAVVIHAEQNAINQMQYDERFELDKTGYTFYIAPLYPCEVCAMAIVEWSFKRVVAYCGQSSADWLQSAKKAEKIFADYGVEYIKVEDD